MLPTDYQARKEIPLYDFLTGYFPDAIVELVKVAVEGNKQHNPGEKLHWARGKSMDQMNTAQRHMFDHAVNPKDTDGTYHLAKAAWRLLAQLQLMCEAEQEADRGFDEMSATEVELRRAGRQVIENDAKWCGPIHIGDIFAPMQAGEQSELYDIKGVTMGSVVFQVRGGTVIHSSSCKEFRRTHRLVGRPSLMAQGAVGLPPTPAQQESLCQQYQPPSSAQWQQPATAVAISAFPKVSDESL